MSRAAVSVVVPFAGASDALDELLEALARLHTRAGDELIVAHNRRAAGAEEHRAGALIFGAAGVRAPGYARNRGAERAHNPWLLFLDADTRPEPDLLDAMFRPSPGERTAVLAGEVVDVAGPSLAARHAAARQQLSQQHTLSRGAHAYAVSANLAVRADAFSAVRGFAATARAGADADLCLRLRRNGWELEYRPQAVAHHLTRSTLSARLVQLARHGAGAAWVERRHPGAIPALGVSGLARRSAHHLRCAAAELRAGHREEAALQLLDLAGGAAFEAGRLMPNRARGMRGSRL
jgi:GT2 family glycosyltransferase